MVDFIMLIGLPASGKSTYAQEYVKQHDNCVTISSDSIRKELYGSEEIQGVSSEIFDIMRKRTKKNLKKGINVIYDATNINYKMRIDFLNQLSKIKDLRKIANLIYTSYNECIENNNKRERNVPEEVIERMYKNFYIPYYYEGWDEINIIHIDEYQKYNKSISALFDSLNISQDNPHHTLSISEHCRETFNEITQFSNISHTLREAALLHDIGKGFTKKFEDSRGNHTEITHYYQHHLVGAYDSLAYKSNSDSDILLRAIYIQWHMKPFDFVSNINSEIKFKKLVGDSIYDNVMLLHKCDLLAH